MVLGSVFEFGRGVGDEDVSTTVSMSSPSPDQLIYGFLLIRQPEES